MYNKQPPPPAKKTKQLSVLPPAKEAACGNLHQEEEILLGAGTKPVGAASGWTLYHLHDPASVVEEGVTCVRKTLHVDQLG